MLLQRSDILRPHLAWMPPCFIRWIEVHEKEGCRQGLHFSHLHSASFCHQTSRVSQADPAITLAYCSGLRRDLYISGVEAFWTRPKLQEG